jgi:hypothetical protein
MCAFGTKRDSVCIASKFLPAGSLAERSGSGKEQVRTMKASKTRFAGPIARYENTNGRARRFDCRKY